MRSWLKIYKFHIYLLTLHHAMQCNLVKQGTKHDLTKNHLVLKTIEWLVAIAKDWIWTALVTTKIMSNLYAFFLRSNTHITLFTALEFSMGGFCYWPQGQQTLISQASKSLWIRRQALNIMVLMKLSILLSKYINFNESACFYSVEISPDVYHTNYLI